MTSINLQEIIKNIVKEPPREAKFYYLDLEIKNEDLLLNKTKDEIKELQYANMAQILMTIFSNICGILYESVTPRNITKEQFEIINKYIESLGYRVNKEYIYEKKDIDGVLTDVPTNLNLWFEKL